MPHQLPPFGVSNSSNVVENCIGSRVRVLVNEDDSFTYKATVLVTDDFETTVLLDPLDDFQSNTLFGNSFNDLVQEGNHAIFENDEVRVHRVYPLATPLKNDECKYDSALPPPSRLATLTCILLTNHLQPLLRSIRGLRTFSLPPLLTPKRPIFFLLLSSTTLLSRLATKSAWGQLA